MQWSWPATQVTQSFIYCSACKRILQPVTVTVTARWLPAAQHSLRNMLMHGKIKIESIIESIIETDDSGNDYEYFPA